MLQERGSGAHIQKRRTSGEPHTIPSAMERKPTARDIARAIARCVPRRAIGHPSRPDSAAIPSVDPRPNSEI